MYSNARPRAIIPTSDNQVIVSPSGLMIIIWEDHITISSGEAYVIYYIPREYSLIKFAGEMVEGEYQYPLKLDEFSGTITLLLVAGNQIDKMNTRYEYTIENGELSLRQWNSNDEELVIMLGPNGYRQIIDIGGDVFIKSPLGELIVGDDEIELYDIELYNFTEQYLLLNDGTVMDLQTGKVAWKPKKYIRDIENINITGHYMLINDNLERMVQVINLIDKEVREYPDQYGIDRILGYDEENQVVVGIVEEPEPRHAQYLVISTPEDSYVLVEDVLNVWYYGSCIVYIADGEQRIITELCP